MIISILDYGVGNISSVKNALKFLNIKFRVIKNSQGIKSSSSIILPGVGSFYHAVGHMKKKKIFNQLRYQIKVKKTPVLGICLGMQVFFDQSEEIKYTKGFGFIKGKVVPIHKKQKKIKTNLNVGWYNVKYKSKKDSLFEGINNNQSFYFTHSYTPKGVKKEFVTATYYDDAKIIAVVQLENIFGIQFHPERSGKNGLKILENFYKISKRIQELS
tara:strand:+ start:571 stop:1215 length:645 start_codon:yes stop_codon:yes gene_type:complete